MIHAYFPREKSLMKENKFTVTASCPQGREMYDLIVRLFGLCRSITGDGVRETLRIIKDYLAGLTIHEVPTGEHCFDWIVPDEWNIREAYVLDEKGKKIIDFLENNLHVVGYSVPVDKDVSLDELQDHLFSLPEMPDAIPYRTSYYKPFWGFCLKHRQRERLTEQRYRVVIDSELKPGSLTYAEFVIPGRYDKEIFFSTYICHPSMANNELSGPALATFLGRWLNFRDNAYTYRFVFVPETIGAIVYLSQHVEHLRNKTAAAFNLTCVGDDRKVSFLPSHRGNTLTDRVARHVLKHLAPEFEEYNFILDRGSDERQYCSPGADLPMVSIMRSKYGNYPEYHTSLDDLSVVSPDGLQTSFDLHKECVLLFEANATYRTTIIGDPHLARHGLDEELVGGRAVNDKRKIIQDFMACCDGATDLISIAEQIGVYAGDLIPYAAKLVNLELIDEVQET